MALPTCASMPMQHRCPLCEAQSQTESLRVLSLINSLLLWYHLRFCCEANYQAQSSNLCIELHLHPTSHCKRAGKPISVRRCCSLVLVSNAEPFCIHGAEVHAPPKWRGRCSLGSCGCVPDSAGASEAEQPSWPCSPSSCISRG